MAAALADFRRGDTVRIKMQYAAGTDLTGFKFWLTLKASLADTDAAAVLQADTTAGEDSGDDETNGIVYLTASAAATAAIAPGKYFWDIQSKAPGGEVCTIAPSVADYKIKVTVIDDITVTTA